MRLQLSVILLLIGSLFGCRAKSEVQISRSTTSTEEIGVELRRDDSLWSFLAENQYLKIEFYPPYTLGSENSESDEPRMETSSSSRGSNPPSAPLGQTSDNVGRTLSGGVVGGLGAVKSIEINKETCKETFSRSQVDSTAEKKAAYEDDLHKEKASEARQDNGSVAILAVVAAVALLAYVAIKNTLS